MKIYKNHINFFESYVSTDTSRQPLTCLYLDMDTVKERRANLVGTDASCLGSIDVELSESDIKSYLIPFEHLKVAKGYLSDIHRFVEVENIGDKIYYKTPKATIEVDSIERYHFPQYKNVTDTIKKPEYVIKVSAKLLKKVADSHIKIGNTQVALRMSGTGEPVVFDGWMGNVKSILMPIRHEEKGTLQQ